MALYLTIVNGLKTLVSGIATSTGPSDAGKFVETGANGLIDPSFFPGSIGQSTRTATASEALAAGDFVNFHGTNQVRKASAAAGARYPAHGFVLASVANAGTAIVYRVGVNGSLTGLTQGATYFLSATTAGAVTTTAPTGAGQMIQSLGYADSATSINFDFDEPVFIQ